VPFVSNGFYNNGVVGFVTPINGERTFTGRAICVSAFCEATVQEPTFLPRGNGGSGMVVLIPEEEMNKEELFYYAAQINKQRWRFSFGRMANPDRIKKLEIDDYTGINLKYSKIEKELLPKPKIKNVLQFEAIKNIKINNMFKIVRGKGKYLINLEEGKTPLVSARNFENGIIGYVNLPPMFKAPAITVERVTGSAFVQLRDFGSVDLYIPNFIYPLFIH
jgi:hypothetical protein